MTTLSKLAIELIVEDGKLRAGLASSARSVDQFGSRISSALNFAKNAAAAIGVFAALRSAAMGVSQAFQDIESQGNLAQSIGASAESFSELAYSAGRANVDVATLAGSMKKMASFIDSARAGSKSQVETLKRLGLEASKISQKPTEAFEQFADAIMSISDPYQRAAAAQDVFGGSFQSLMPLLAGGSRGLRESAEAARQFGMSFGEQQRAQIEAANNAWGDLKALVTGAFRTIAVESSVAFTAVAQHIQSYAGIFQTFMQHATSGFTQWAVDSEEISLSMFESIQAAAGNFVQSFLQQIGYLQVAWQTMWAQIATVQANTIAAIEKALTGSISSTVNSYLEGAAELRRVARDTAKRQEDFLASKTFGETMLRAKRDAADLAKQRMKALGQGLSIPQFEGGSGGGFGARGASPFPGAVSGADAFSKALENRRNADDKFQQKVLEKIDEAIVAIESVIDFEPALLEVPVN